MQADLENDGSSKMLYRSNNKLSNMSNYSDSNNIRMSIESPLLYRLPLNSKSEVFDKIDKFMELSSVKVSSNQERRSEDGLDDKMTKKSLKKRTVNHRGEGFHYLKV
jgi:hypothetical protein